MMRISLLLAVPLMLAACSDAEAPTDPDVQDPAALNGDDNVTVEEAPAVPQLDLSGSWSITRFNGRGNISTHPITVTFADDRMTLSSRCITHVYALNRTGNIIAPERVSAETCPVGLSQAEQMLETAMPQMNVVVARGEEALSFSGPGGNLTLGREGAPDAS